MASREVLKLRLQYKKEALEEAKKAYLELLKGGVKAYAIGGKNLTKFDIPTLENTIAKLEKEVDILETQVAGGKPRKAFGVVPRDF